MKNVTVATYQEAAKKFEQSLPNFPEKVVIRMGGQMAYDNFPIQINSQQAIRNSIDKIVQKELLIEAGIKTLPILKKLKYPCVIKGRVRSCGTKVFILNNDREYNEAMIKLKHDAYLEPLFEATSEYRMHCTRDEVFFEVKKIKRNPEDILINHKNHYNTREFVKPRLYKQIHAECLKAMEALDLDIACFDIMYSSKGEHSFMIAEANTNAELLQNTYEAYEKALIKLIEAKIGAKIKEEKPKKIVLSNEQKLALIDLIMTNKCIIENDFIKFKL